MAIRFPCQHCDKPLKVVDEKIGKKVVCNGCGKISKVPESDTITMNNMGVRRRPDGEKSGQSYEELIASYGSSEYGTTSSKINALQSLRLMLRPIVIIAIVILVLIGAYVVGSSMLP